MAAVQQAHQNFAAPCTFVGSWVGESLHCSCCSLTCFDAARALTAIGTERVRVEPDSTARNEPQRALSLWLPLRCLQVVETTA